MGFALFLVEEKKLQIQKLNLVLQRSCHTITMLLLLGFLLENSMFLFVKVPSLKIMSDITNES